MSEQSSNTNAAQYAKQQSQVALANRAEANALQRRDQSEAERYARQHSNEFSQFLHEPEFPSLANNPLPFEFLTQTAAPTLDNNSTETFNGQAYASNPSHLPQSETENTAFTQNLMNKLSQIATVRDMSFSIENRQGAIQVEAFMAGSILRCAMRTSSEALRKRLNESRNTITRSLGNGLRVNVELAIH